MAEPRTKRAAVAGAKESFETLYASLEERARKLEQGNLPLEESLKLYEEGASVAAKLRDLLKQAELRIARVQLTSSADDEASSFREDEVEYDAGE